MKRERLIRKKKESAEESSRVRTSDGLRAREIQSGRRAAQKAKTAQPDQKKSGDRTSIGTEIKMLLMKIGLIVVFFLILFTMFFGIMQQPDNSMSPAIKEGDLIIFYRLDKQFESGEVMVLKNQEGDLQCRRVKGVPGDELEITDKGLVVNGYVQQEDDIYTETLPYKGDVVYPVSIQEGNYFVLADYREDTEDSRVYGQVSESAVKGTVLMTIRRRGI